MASRSTSLVLYHPSVRRLTSLNRRLAALLPEVERIWMEALERRILLSGGTVDTSFGQGGIASAFGSASSASAYALAVLPNDNIVVAGSATQADGSSPPALAMFNANGSLDTAFGSGGTVVTPLNGDDGTFETVLPLANGKILAAGEDDTLDQFMLAEYNADGSLDTSFGQGGVVTTPNANDASGDGAIYGLAIQSDGKILALGEANSEMTVARYNADGSLDSSFGNAGIAMAQGNTADIDEYSLAATVQSDGSINVYGAGTGDNSTFWGANYVLQLTSSGQQTSLQEYDRPSNDGNYPAAITGPDGKVIVSNGYLSRYNADGSPDNTFGSDGTFGSLSSGAIAVGVRADGAVFAVDSNYDLERYNPDGTVNTSFGDQGIGQLPADSTDPNAPPNPFDNLGNATAIGFQSDGSIIVADDSFNLVRFEPGTDATPPQPTAPSTLVPPAVVEPTAITRPHIPLFFGAAGTVTTSDPGTTTVTTFKPIYNPTTGSTGSAPNYQAFDPTNIVYGNVAAAAVQPNGQIIAAGTSDDVSDFSDPQQITLARFNADGSVDTSFGNGGTVQTSIGADDASVTSVTVLPNGQILVAGNDQEAGTFLLARYNADGSLDTTFGNGGIVNAVTPASADGYNNLDGVTAAPDGSIIAFGDDGTNIILARFNPDGSPDTTFGSGGVLSKLVNPTDQSETPVSVTVNADSTLLLAYSNVDVNGNYNNYTVALSATGQQLANPVASTVSSANYTPLATLADGSTVTAGDGFSLWLYPPGATPTVVPIDLFGSVSLGGKASGPTVVVKYGSAGSPGSPINSSVFTLLSDLASEYDVLNQYVTLSPATGGVATASTISDPALQAPGSFDNGILASTDPLASFSQGAHKPDDWIDTGTGDALS